MGVGFGDRMNGKGASAPVVPDPLPATCLLAAAEHQMPPNAETLVASEMAAFLARAAKIKGWRSAENTPRTLTAIFVVLALLRIRKNLFLTIQAGIDGKPWLGDLASDLGVVAFLGVLAFLATMPLRGQVKRWKAFCFKLAGALQGKAGLDGLSTVASWISTRWRWFLPPDFCMRDVLWAEGSRRGFPVLFVMEHDMIGFTWSVATSRLSGGRSPGVTSWQMRTSLFIQGARLQDARHRERLVQKLQLGRGGVVQCPSGVYLYSTYVYGGMHDEPEEHTAGWMDLIDQVIDPGYQGLPQFNIAQPQAHAR